MFIQWFIHLWFKVKYSMGHCRCARMEVDGEAAEFIQRQKNEISDLLKTALSSEKTWYVSRRYSSTVLHLTVCLRVFT
jgi:hypothetical protein